MRACVLQCSDVPAPPPLLPRTQSPHPTPPPVAVYHAQREEAEVSSKQRGWKEVAWRSAYLFVNYWLVTIKIHLLILEKNLAQYTLTLYFDTCSRRFVNLSHDNFFNLKILTLRNGIHYKSNGGLV